ncbi:MAG TPA: hypothetical protein DCY48_00325 [Candidatus Magasanikbacteria bacterium]|nr:MAG: hypothetical protein A3I74_02770 [Candidatus Magasanikbacteria bacterium RIFCSPLOWO2_02_FULL_47_16]OGH79582.1 MAG: hypothetical protein A3C10_00630 [Candidatus Magasanikbacteria bacterium RIFCSPHIGHO2_02_FULL_48_18]HAZ28213.1 hypothetical protein [Candidatus Magasanikbacteria bacterium]
MLPRESGPSPEEIGIETNVEETMDLPPAPPNLFDDKAVEEHNKKMEEWKERQKNNKTTE